MAELPAALDIDLREALRGELAADLPLVLEATEEIRAAIEHSDLSPLARCSPALLGNDWAGYLHCSTARVVHALAALRRTGAASGRILDYGSYFGNFALALARAGYQVDVVDSYGSYGAVFEPMLRRLDAAGVRVLRFEDCGFELTSIPAGAYDAVLCMSVIEHVPHTPRYMLDAVDRVLKDDGRLLLETPNLAYIYNRQRLARGESMMAPLQSQYYTDRVYEGHHREYTLDEVAWLVHQLGHELIRVEAFNYSYYSIGTLTGRDLENFTAMRADPSLRELLLAVSRKTAGARALPSAGLQPGSWRSAFVETEAHWRKSTELPTSSGSLGDPYLDHESALVSLRAQLERLSSEVNLRDTLLAELQATANAQQTSIAALQREVNLRDSMLREQQLLSGARERELLAAIERASLQARLERVSSDVNLRDGLLAELQATANAQQASIAELQREVNLRDAMLREQQAHSGAREQELLAAIERAPGECCGAADCSDGEPRLDGPAQGPGR